MVSPGIRRLRRLAGLVRAGDLATLLTWLTRRIGPLCFERLHVLRRSVLDARPGDGRAETAVDYRTSHATRGDLPRLAALFPHNAFEYAERLSRGDRCLLLHLPEGLAGMIWIRLDHGGLHQQGCRLRLPPGACWCYDSFVLPRHRHHGLGRALMRDALLLMKELDLSWCYAAIHHDNKASMRAHTRIGFEPVARIDSLERGRLGVHRLSRATGRGRWRWTTPGRWPASPFAV